MKKKDIERGKKMLCSKIINIQPKMKLMSDNKMKIPSSFKNKNNVVNIFEGMSLCVEKNMICCYKLYMCVLI